MNRYKLEMFEPRFKVGDRVYRGHMWLVVVGVTENVNGFFYLMSPEYPNLLQVRDEWRPINKPTRGSPQKIVAISSINHYNKKNET